MKNNYALILIVFFTLNSFNLFSQANAGSDQSGACDVATLNATFMAGGWWTTNEPNVIIINSLDPYSQVTNLNYGGNVFTWNTPTGPPFSDDVTITSNQIYANSGTDVEICTDSYNLTAISPAFGTGVWSLISGSAVFVDVSLNNTFVNNIAVGSNTYRWTVTNGSCIDYSDVVITNNSVNSVAGSDSETCTNTSPLIASIPSSGVGVWSLIGGAGIIADQNANNTSVTNLASGLNTFRWTVTDGICSSTDDIIIANNSVIANAGSDALTCIDSYPLNATNPIIGTGVWTVLGGTGIINIPTKHNSIITNLSFGINTLSWTVSQSICSQSNNVSISYVTNITANAGADTEICTDSYNLNAVTPASGSGIWSLISGSGTIADQNVNNTSVTNLNSGINSFRWTITDGSCVASDDVVITNSSVVANAGIDAEVCGTSYTLNATDPIIGVGLWTLQSGSGTLSDPILYNSNIINLSLGVNTLMWTVTQSICTDSDNIMITAFETILSDAGLDDNVCSESYNLNGMDPFPGIGNWTSSSPLVNFSDVNDPYTQAFSYPIGVTTLTWTITNGPCTSSNSMNLTKYAAPIPEINGDTVACSNASNLLYSNPITDPGTIYNWSVFGGSYTQGANPNEIIVNWDNTSFDASIDLSVDYVDGCTGYTTFPVKIELEKIPIIRPKGESLLICLDSGMVNYQWFVNNEPLLNEHRQYYYSENLNGNYAVETTSENNCIWRSELFPSIAKKLKLFPNPVSNEINIEIYDSETGTATFRLKDLSGKLIKTINVYKSTSILNVKIPINEVKTGVYTLNILINNNTYSTGRLIVQ